MGEFFNLLENAKINKEFIFRKILLLNMYVVRDPQFFELASSESYNKLLESFKHPGLTTDIYTTPAATADQIEQIYYNADQLINMLKAFVDVKNITTSEAVTTSLQEIISRSAF